MKRAAVAVALAVAAAGCQYANSIAPETTPVTVRAMGPADFVSNGFRIHLDPTVMVWADETAIDFRAAVRASLGRIEGALHGPPVSVSIAAGSYMPIPDVGIGGQTDRRTGDVQIAMDARRPTSAKDFLTIWVPIAMAHELHHSDRIVAGPGYGATLLEAVVTEGTAEAFVRETFPSAPPIPWVARLSPAEESAVWKRLRPALNAPDGLDIHQQWFVGGGPLPAWPGYRLGYEVVGRYLSRHPGTTAASLARIPARRILDGSGFAAAMDSRTQG
jgi:hypothetical protein